MTLRIDSLFVGYGAKTVLNAVTLRASKGELIGLLGSNGSGKSTLIKTIAGINRPSSGTISWNGATNLARLSRRDLAKIVSYVPQNIGQAFALDIREAVLLGRTPHFGTCPGEADWAHVERAIRLLELDELGNRDVTKLSGGQGQRVLIARALAQNAEVLLLDEPTSALDIRYQWQTLSVVRQITRQNDIAGIIAIHDLNQAARFTDRVVFLHEGQVVADGPAADVYSPELIHRVYGVDVELSTYKGYVQVHPGEAHDPPAHAATRDASSVAA